MDCRTVTDRGQLDLPIDLPKLRPLHLGTVLLLLASSSRNPKQQLCFQLPLLDSGLLLIICAGRYSDFALLIWAIVAELNRAVPRLWGRHEIRRQFRYNSAVSWPESWLLVGG